MEKHILIHIQMSRYFHLEKKKIHTFKNLVIAIMEWARAKTNQKSLESN